MEWLEGFECESGRSIRDSETRVEVRAFIVAEKPRKRDGANGRRKVDARNRDRRKKTVVKSVPRGLYKAETPRDWVEPDVWTKRMLAALETGVKVSNDYFGDFGLFSLMAAYRLACQSS